MSPKNQSLIKGHLIEIFSGALLAVNHRHILLFIIIT